MTNKKNDENKTADLDMDRTLILKVKNGDKNALGKLVERHKKTAYQMALGLVSNRDDAYDISQEAFLRVYRSASTFDDAKPFLPWFYTIITNLSRTWLKRRSVNQKRSVDVDEVPFLLVSDDNPERNLIQREAILGLQKALRKLSFADREIINLQHFRNMSYDEIAIFLEIPRGTVMSRLYYARKKLAVLMRENDG